MNPALPPRWPRSAVILAASFVLVGALAFTLTQCRPVNDEIVKPRAANAGNCISECAHAFADSVQAESAVHVSNVHACAGDTTCLANEETRHEAAVAEIDAGRQACQDRCHQQGGGSGGQ